MSLSERLREGVECAPWVIGEVKMLEEQITTSQEVIEFQKKAWTADHEYLTSQISELEASPVSEEALDILRSKIAKQSAALKLASLALSEGVEYVEEPPEKNCTCHLAPPCNDCVDHSAVREFFIDARKALAAIDALEGE